MANQAQQKHTSSAASNQSEAANKPGPLARTGAHLLNVAERIIARTSRIGDRAIYDTSEFPWSHAVEAKWETIRGELESVLNRRDELPNFQDVAPEVGNINTDNQWKTFFFFGYGIRCEENCRLCPETARIVQAIPGMKTAFFSILSPRKHIPAHRGPYKGVLRYHLGLLVPRDQEHCRIRVDDRYYHWDVGESLIFDDTYDHEVWNETDEPRVVLFVDFVRPCRFPGNLINAFILGIAAWLPELRKARRNHDRWERNFYH